MKSFIHKDFLLQTDAARELYHGHAKNQPIIDYHCHLDPAHIANDRKFDNLGQIWLEGDHYKWRAMRTNGVDERYCTGKDTGDWEKFEKWSKPCHIPCAIPSITGPIWNLKRPSAWRSC